MVELQQCDCCNEIFPSLDTHLKESKYCIQYQNLFLPPGGISPQDVCLNSGVTYKTRLKANEPMIIQCSDGSKRTIIYPPPEISTSLNREDSLRTDRSRDLVKLGRGTECHFCMLLDSHSKERKSFDTLEEYTSHVLICEPEINKEPSSRSVATLLEIYKKGYDNKISAIRAEYDKKEILNKRKIRMLEMQLKAEESFSEDYLKDTRRLRATRNKYRHKLDDYQRVTKEEHPSDSEIYSENDDDGEEETEFDKNFDEIFNNAKTISKERLGELVGNILRTANSSGVTTTFNNTTIRRN
jgi:hypothetical protein